MMDLFTSYCPGLGASIDSLLWKMKVRLAVDPKPPFLVFSKKAFLKLSWAKPCSNTL